MRKLHILFATLTVFAINVHAYAASNMGEPYDVDYEKKAGLPQLDPTFYVSQLFWLAITFATLYFLFSKNILPTISGILENRHEHIQDDLDTAETLKKEAEEVHASYEKKMNDARERVTTLYADIETEITNNAELSLQGFQEKFAKEISIAEAKLDKTKKEALKEMDSIAAEISSIAAKKIVDVDLDPGKAEDIIKNINKAKAA